MNSSVRKKTTKLQHVRQGDQHVISLEVPLHDHISIEVIILTIAKQYMIFLCFLSSMPSLKSFRLAIQPRWISQHTKLLYIYIYITFSYHIPSETNPTRTCKIKLKEHKRYHIGIWKLRYKQYLCFGQKKQGQ